MVNVMNIPDRHLPSEDNWAFRYEVVSPRRGTDRHCASAFPRRVGDECM